ncbi:MAG: alpha-mannosidase [Actinomycetota bacterium]
MHITNEQRLDLIRERTEEITLWRDRSFVHLDGWTFEGRPLPRGAPWPERGGVRELGLPRVTIPELWPLDESRLELDVGGEGLLCLRYGGGRESRFGLDPNHQVFPLDERTFEVQVRAVARLPFGQPSRDARVKLSRLVWIDDVVNGFARRLTLIAEAARTLGSDPVIEPLISCAEAALNRIRWPSSTGAYVSRSAPSSRLRTVWELPEDLDPHPPDLTDEERASVASASEQLAQELESLKRRYPQHGELSLTGHAHLDLAWLWPMEETRRKAVRTYETVTNLMERYPEFKFNQSSAQVYAFIEEEEPDLFARIKKKVDTGQWEPIGGMWVEPDTNMPCGESLVRQLLYGQRYFKQKFDAEHRVCWLPDCFGFSPVLPQLLVDAGIENFFTHKLNWSETNRFPYDLFWWEGSDGSRVLAHSFDNPLGGYNGDVSPEEVVRTWQNFRGKHHHGESLLSVGFGDGGGGPTEEMIERARILEGFPAVPELRFALVDEFFERLHERVAKENIPVWVGEMYLELHRGTLTTQGRVKYLNRRAERDLVAAEVLSAVGALAGGQAPRSLEDEWRVLLRNQFHDILPGSSIREVNLTAEEELGGVVARAGRMIDRGLEQLGPLVAAPGDREGLIVFNPDLSSRPLMLELQGSLPGAQEVEQGSVITSDEAIEGLEVRTVLHASPPSELSVSTSHLENGFVRVELDSAGTIDRVFDKRATREVLAGRGNQLWAFVDKPREWDAWDIDASYMSSGEEIASLDSIDVVESGPHRAAIRIRRSFRSSTIVQDVRLWANSPRIEFRTSLDWADRRWLLKARFPLAIRSNVAVFESAFGVVERSTHRNTSWHAAQFEVVGHRFADLSEAGYGVALLNDGKYGHHVMGNELGISLLRSPIYPDPLADEGRHSFTYALYPHEGTWQEGGVLAAAEDLNRPLVCRRIAVAQESSWRPLRLWGTALGLGALKVLEDGGGLVLRCYEPHGARGEVGLDLPPGWKLEAELNVLEQAVGPAERSFTPFRVRSWLLTRSGHQRSQPDEGPD